jgi:flagellar basal-body rod modification protein FlgD
MTTPAVTPASTPTGAAAAGATPASSAKPASSAAPAGSAAPASSAQPENPNAVLGQNDFLKLMIAQLQAQNPLEPGNSNEFVNELAQFTQVEQTTNIANASELSGAVQLIGHKVTYNGASGAPATGTVESVQSNANGTTVTIEGVAGIKLASITEVQ